MATRFPPLLAPTQLPDLAVFGSRIERDGSGPGQQEGGPRGGGIGVTSSTPPVDLAILAGAANQLFESSSSMSLEAAVSLLYALAEVSALSLPTQVRQGGGERGWGMSRMCLPVSLSA